MIKRYEKILNKKIIKKNRGIGPGGSQPGRRRGTTMNKYTMERREGQKSRVICALWREVELETSQW